MKEKDLDQSNMQADQSQGHMGFLPALEAKYGFVGDNAWNPPTQGSDSLLPVETEYQNYTEQSLSSSSDLLVYWVVDLLYEDPEEKVHDAHLTCQQELDQMLAEALRDDELDNVPDTIELFGHSPR
ncbi:hypothetical protein JVT61DRAFT_10368 [Boletus reticuloceps]|uniref:Uncharacterized protein n=1 Tax=Boletus reticuloceps TaxID=495285 RepID=A0A8I3AEU5_9AGAM|nr:hypothetical protein JVT61DRAFT_10368 [Boletus reticuloceps]